MPRPGTHSLPNTLAYVLVRVLEQVTCLRVGSSLRCLLERQAHHNIADTCRFSHEDLDEQSALPNILLAHRLADTLVSCETSTRRCLEAIEMAFAVSSKT